MCRRRPNRRTRPGIPLAMRRRRAARISDLRYDLALTFPKPLTEPITGTTRIGFDLDRQPRSARHRLRDQPRAREERSANGATPPSTWTNGHIVVPGRRAEDRREPDRRSRSSPGDASLNRSAGFSSTRCSCRRGRTWRFPCFDQPDLKARWSLTLDAPGRMAGWRATAPSSSGTTPPGDRRRHVPLRRDAAALHLSLLVRRRRLQGRDRRAQRPHVPHVPPRDRRRQGRAQQATPSSTCTRAPSPSWSSTPASPTRSASSTSC